MRTPGIEPSCQNRGSHYNHYTIISKSIIDNHGALVIMVSSVVTTPIRFRVLALLILVKLTRDLTFENIRQALRFRIGHKKILLDALASLGGHRERDPTHTKRVEERRLHSLLRKSLYNTLRHTATHCNTLQHTATHCNTLHCSGDHMF